MNKIPAALLALTTGCVSGGAFDRDPIANDRNILEWTGGAGIDANNAIVPAGFTADEHVCAADPTRGYLAELATNGIGDIQVQYHWAPVIPGPREGLPTIQQPELSLQGQVVGTNDSTDDVLADHPFGFDVNHDVMLDAPYAFLSFQPDEGPDGMIHTEVETRLFPRDPLAFAPAPGDRTLMRGVWVLDCGHPPYGAEMHPPTFVSYARATDAENTMSIALVFPYRSSLLFNPNVSLATAFEDNDRFTHPDTATFAKALIDAVAKAIVERADRLTSHALMVANRFDTLRWHVCAPLPRPPDAKFAATWRFTARTGVSIHVLRDDDAGCVRFQATMDQTYQPMPLTFADQDWPWDELSKSASGQLGEPIDVRTAIIDAIPTAVDAPALEADHPPKIDAYGTLSVREGAGLDEPADIVSRADDQPFPFYGKVRVGWAK